MSILDADRFDFVFKIASKKVYGQTAFYKEIEQVQLLFNLELSKVVTFSGFHVPIFVGLTTWWKKDHFSSVSSYTVKRRRVTIVWRNSFSSALLHLRAFTKQKGICFLLPFNKQRSLDQDMQIEFPFSLCMLILISFLVSTPNSKETNKIQKCAP